MSDVSGSPDVPVPEVDGPSPGHVGAGYRLYFARRGSRLIVMLAGGDKSNQSRDIQRAKKLARELEDDS
jgi:hypothetical protein